jgi:hypothetical protein
MKEGSYCDLKMLANYLTSIITLYLPFMYMRKKGVLVLFCALVILAICAGCAGNPPSGTTPTTQATPPPTTPFIPATVGLSLTPGPVQTLPPGADLTFQVMAGPSLINPTAIVYFRGGAGQSQVQSIVVTLIRADGQSDTKNLEPKVGSYVEFPVTRGLYRVVIRVTLTSGQQLLIWDKTEDWNSHA